MYIISGSSIIIRKEYEYSLSKLLMMQRDDMMEDIEFNIKSVDMNDSQVQK